MTFERLIGRRLKERIASAELPAELLSGQWFRFEDANGTGYCQVDHYMICPGFILLIECKLTQSDFAHDQMTELYKPILEHIYGVPVVCIQVFKFMRRSPPNRIDDIKELVFKPRHGVHSWHYTGH